MHRRSPLRVAALAATLLAIPTASAQPDDGWHPRLSLGVSISFANSHAVVGAQPGQTVAIAPSLDFGADFLSGPHHWRTTLVIAVGLGRTRLIDELVKGDDRLVLESLYRLHIDSVAWLDPFVGIGLRTALFPQQDLQATRVTYAIEQADGTRREDAGDRLDLTNAFSPLELAQSLGAAATPVDGKLLAVEVRLGAGAREVFVRGGYVVNDDEKTPDVLEVDRLEDYQQVGVELSGRIWGAVDWEEPGPVRALHYSVTAQSLLPFYASVDDRSGLDRITLAIEARLGIGFLRWLSLDYALVVAREPLLLDAVQVQNNLLLSFSWALVE